MSSFTPITVGLRLTAADRPHSHEGEGAIPSAVEGGAGKVHRIRPLHGKTCATMSSHKHIMGEISREDFPGYEALYDQFDREWKAIAMALVNEGKK